MYNVIDLFAGAGGLSLGFQQTQKYCIKVAFENNPTMQETYKKNFPSVEVQGDVCKADYDKIKKQYGPIDVVIGGPPCQGFSNANRQKNHMISHNNSLVKEYIRAILQLKPQAFIMENVSMLRSDVHRFFLSKEDEHLVNDSRLEMKTTIIPLLDQQFLFDGAEKLIIDEKKIRKNLWQDSVYSELNVIYKALRNPQKLIYALNKHKSRILKIISEDSNDGKELAIKTADKNAFSALLKYYNGDFPADNIKSEIEPAIMYQRMLSRSLEIIDNNLVVDHISAENGLFAEIRSFAVFDYLKELLSSKDGNDGYNLAPDVLCAADFGAPQKRMRFIIIGIRKDISNKAVLPSGKFDEKTYRTVYDAIADLEGIEPVSDVEDDVGIKLKSEKNLSDLAKSLRDTKVLKNHIITKTTSIAMKRFKALKQGENFHALTDDLKTNTYTDVSRTQNTIYLRLDYQQPSGTVVNVRKSMWIHPVKNRAVSIREAARLQTFPDSFIFTGTKDKQYQQVGNAVPPILAKAIAEELARQLSSCKEE